MKSALQFRPLRLHSRTSSPSFSATIRKPSCFSSCSHPSPSGTFVASTGRAGRINPGGCRGFGRTQRCGVRINTAGDLQFSFSNSE